MAERIIRITVPGEPLDSIRESFEQGERVTRKVVEKEVRNIIEGLEAKGVVRREADDISVSLVPDYKLPSTATTRKVQAIQVFRDGDSGAVDAVEESYIIEVRDNKAN